MTLQYEILKRLVKAANIKKRWTGMSTQALLDDRRRANARNRIPDLKDGAFAISRIEVMGFPVLKLIHREKADRANLFLIGGGMISAPRPGAVKKALRTYPFPVISKWFRLTMMSPSCRIFDSSLDSAERSTFR